jgi:hypothetical protein
MENSFQQSGVMCVATPTNVSTDFHQFSCSSREAVTGKGPLGQLGLETGIPLFEAEPLLLLSIAFTLFASINEGSGRFTNDDK